MRFDILLGILLLVLLGVFSYNVLTERSPCDTVCEIQYLDGTSERIICSHLEKDETTLTVQTADERMYKPLSAIKGVKITAASNFEKAKKEKEHGK